MDNSEFDAEAACDFALQWAIATQWANRESSRIQADESRRRRRCRWRHGTHGIKGMLQQFVPNLDLIAEERCDADIDDEVEIDKASLLRELEQEERRNMEEADTASFLRELYEQCWDMILDGIDACG